jgi:3-deoxy-7-phosphoheptulonate synthase
MLIIMKLESPKQDIELVRNKICDKGCVQHEIPGASKLGIGITGPTNLLKEDDFLNLGSVEEVIRVTKPYKLVSREMKQENTVINFNQTTIGGEEIAIIAGPCSIESRQQLFDIGGELKEMGIKFLRAGVYKPRSSPYSFHGLKEKGLLYLSEVKTEFGMKIVTEVKDTKSLPFIAEIADIIQIGTRNMQNFSLLEEVGQLTNTILLKKGMAATIEDLLMRAEYILSQGNFNVILCERCTRTFETMTINTLDLNAIPMIKKNSHLPIIVDPSHAIGIWYKVTPMAMAATACGADGFMIEVHNPPDHALSDGSQSLNPKNFRKLLDKIGQLAPIVDRKINYYAQVS